MLINYIRSQYEALACLFWDVCAQVLSDFIWFSAQSYPIITVCAQPMNTAFALLIQIYVCMYVWAPLEDRGGLEWVWQSDKPWDKRCGQICPADMEEFISITNVHHHSAKTKLNSPPPNGVLERKEGALHQANKTQKQQPAALICLEIVIMMLWHYFLCDRGFTVTPVYSQSMMQWKSNHCFSQNTQLLFSSLN